MADALFTNPEVLAELFAGLLAIVRRHFSETGEILTDEQAKEMLQSELRSGQSDIAQWFIAKGLPVPK